MARFFDYSTEKDLASRLSNDLARDLPPAMMGDRRKVISVNKVTRLLEKTYEAAAAYQRENIPGFIRRAVLANNFKWNLKNKNYPDDFVEMATEGLVVSMAGARKNK
ncbi:hypothetical protein [Xylophilus sp. GOD-11R]|uniref:hypothetical protein n=1 Tax=Xylophilus sp. GOD-11R TaxID=3089814 RepID=UPI00298C2600|nr:hypothetical protein [Xylophilus sp. GOD-11R]WPB56868.1 hypothetical protein R9X41_22490 [Xylophilus sp. GOD-11R]